SSREWQAIPGTCRAPAGGSQLRQAGTFLVPVLPVPDWPNTLRLGFLGGLRLSMERTQNGKPSPLAPRWFPIGEPPLEQDYDRRFSSHSKSSVMPFTSSITTRRMPTPLDTVRVQVWS